MEFVHFEQETKQETKLLALVASVGHIIHS